MKVFVAGATGAIGRQLLPRLVESGHEVTAMSRTPAKSDLIRSLGAASVIADALDPEAVAEAVGRAEPEAIIHQLTAIDVSSVGHSVDKAFAQTNRLRTEGTDHLLAAARAVGTRRFVAQSFAAWQYAPIGGWVKAENDPKNTSPPRSVRQTLAAIRYVEQAVTQAEGVEGIALRYGWFYGPGTSIGLDPVGENVELIRKGRFPIIGGGEGVWSLIHVGDAAAATALALERGGGGVYNVVDDDPAPVRDWLPDLAEAIGAKAPRRVPAWVGRLLAGEAVVFMMTKVRGSSNEKAKRELAWEPRYPSWRLGFRGGLVNSESAPEGRPA